MPLKTEIINIKSQDRDIMLHPSGCIHILDNESGQVSTSIDPPQLIEGYSKWDKLQTPLECFSYSGKKTNWVAPTLSEQTIFLPPGEQNSDRLIIDNHKDNSTNTFIRSGMSEFNFKRNNIYQFSFKFMSSTNLESKYSAMFSPYVLLFDKSKKEIARYKLFTKTNIEQEWITSSHQFEVLHDTKYFECGFFLNSAYKMKLMISEGKIHEYVAPETVDYNPEKWDVSDNTVRNKFEWNSRTSIISSLITGIVEKNSKSLDLTIEIEILKKVSAGELFVNSTHNSVLENLLHRDCHWGNPNADIINIDRWTPKCAEFSSKNHIKSASNFSSLGVFVNKEKSELKFNILNWKDSPNFVFLDTGEQVFEFEQNLEPGTKIKTNIIIQFGDGFECQFGGRAPSGFDSTFVMTHHADATTFHTLEAIMHGSSNPKSKIYGKQGIVSNDLRATWSVFSKSISDQIDEWSITRKATNAIIEIYATAADDAKYESIDINTISTEKDSHTLIKSGFYDFKGSFEEDQIDFNFTLKNLSTDNENIASISALIHFLDSEYNEIIQNSFTPKVGYGDNLDVSNKVELPNNACFAQLSFFETSRSICEYFKS